ncbi:DMT family transporter [Oculatella sp. LEGE 06141]|uniref:DMT family transporter n=1 Tax=Oculatella sp. LEGE 06141 TaxID=1828648 RepID=UPI0018802D43|nr:DMT family transporter [Oculatella sp. LEGE 06141]MBE9178943.1 DMT family transporter [Oculatella sp. LEGE 06141]
MTTAKSASYYWSLLLLIGATLIWGSTFPLLKDTVGTLSPITLVSTRFFIAALAFIPFCRRVNRRLLREGATLGIVSFAAYMTQVIALETTSSNRAAFITSLNVILVPLLGSVLGRSIASKIIMAAGLALVGVGIMSWEGGTLVIGDLWSLGCAVTYAVYILLLEAIAPRHHSLEITAVQIMTIALLGMGWAVPDLIEQRHAITANVGAILYLGLFATAATTWSQAIAQRRISATETAVVYTLEPVFASFFSLWWLGERLGLRGLLGAGMILVATLLSQVTVRGWLKRAE